MAGRTITPALVLFLSSAPLLAQGSAPESFWPFGLPKDPEPMSKGLDLYNFGLLGAKAYDADRPEPSTRMQTGRRSSKSTGGDASTDIGPKRLKIRVLFPGGPAQKAGLKIGDVVVGVGQNSFEKGCLQPLADALLVAESSRKKTPVILRLEDGDGIRELPVFLKSRKSEAANPIAGKGRKRILDAGLKWLASQQQGDGGFPQTLSGTNGAVVQTCLAGLAWIGGGSNLSKGRYTKNLRAAVTFVMRGLVAPDPFAKQRGKPRFDKDGKPLPPANWDQTTWAYAHAAVFLGELYQAKKSRKLKPEIQRIATEICRRKEPTGGYGHGPGKHFPQHKNGLDYVELNIMAGYVLAGLGLAEQAGCKIDRKVVEEYKAYLEKSSGDGGVGYSAGKGQKGSGNIGRTAGAWLGCLTLGLRQDPFVMKMHAYTQKNVDQVLGGHASLMQHIMLAGLAAHALGDKAEAKYWKLMRRDLVLARAPDGSLQPRPWHETVGMGTNSDVGVGDVWTTASWLIVLGCDYKKGGLPGWLGQTRK